MICVCRASFKVHNKTDSLTVTHSKVNIKSINKDECLIFGVTKDKIPTFVTTISHGFTIVP